MKVFKKTALLISVLVLAVVFSIGAIAGISVLSEGDATLGEVYSGVQVTTDGKVNLKVFYSTLGDAEAFVAEVIDPVTNEPTTYNYTASELDETENGYCVKVPLTASQMTHTVKVWATAGDDKSTAMEFTVADYVHSVLADETLSQYHDAMRALLNWGAMAQFKFDDAESVLANKDIFARGTYNPATVVTADAIQVPARGEIDQAFASTNVELSEGTIAMNFKVNLKGSNISGEYTRSDLNGATQALEVTHVSGDTYKVSIRNISVQNFDKVYTVTVNDDNGTYKAEYSMLEYISAVISGNYDTDTKNVVKSMYQFYQQATGKTGADTCAHGVDTFWANKGEEADLKCSECYADLGYTALNSAEFVYTPYQLKGADTNNAVTVMENGAYARFNKKEFSADGYSYATITANNTTKSARYMIMKVRYGENGLGQPNAKVYWAWNETEAQKFPISEDNKWHTIIVDSKQAEGYIPTMIQFRWFNAFDSVMVDDVLTMVGDENDYVDVQYVVMTDSLDEAKSFIDTETYELAIDGSGKAVINTATGACVEHYTTVSSKTNDDGSTTYAVTCSVCSTVCASQNVPADINFYQDLSGMGVWTTPGTVSKNLYENGVLFDRFTLSGACHINPTGGDGAGSLTSGKYPTGKYVTFKYRTNGESYFNINFATGDKKNGNGACSGEQAAANQPVGGWRVAIVDVSGNAQWTSDGSEQQIYAMFLAGKSTVDIAYFAVVDSFEEATLLMGENDQVIYDYGTNFSNTPVIKTKTGDCASHAFTRVDDASDPRGYHFECANCKKIFALDHYVQEVAGYNAASAGYHANITNGTDPAGFTYKSVYFDGKYGTMLNFINKYYGGSNMYSPTINAGRYLVVKIRGTVPEGGQIPFNVATEDSGLTGGKNPIQQPIGALTSANMPSDWTVLVIDLANVGKYSDGTQQKIAFSTATGDGGTATHGVQFDLAYTAIVSDLADLQEFVTEETFKLYIGTVSSDPALRYTSDPYTCVGSHNLAVQEVDGGWKYACIACDYVEKDYGVSVDSSSLYWPAEVLYIKATQFNTEASYGSSVTGKYNQTELMTEDGVTFLRLGDGESNKAETNAWCGWFPIAQGGGYKFPGAGRYMVMKVRQNKNTINASTMGFWVTSTESTNNWASGSFSVSLPADDQWHVIVVDLATRSSDYKADANGEYGPKTIHLRPFNGGSGATLDKYTDETMDFAYWAFFNDLADLKDIVDEETFEFSKAADSSVIYDTATCTCKYHTPTYVADAADARGYHYECAECGIKLAMDYYASGVGSKYNKANVDVLTDSEGFKYVSYTVNEGGAFLDYHTATGGGGGLSSNVVHAGRYLVVKLRGNTAADVPFYIGANDIPNDKDHNNNYSGGYIGALTAETMPTEWTVAVIDLSGLSEFYYMGDYQKIFFASTSKGGSLTKAGAQVDIAYTMIVNDFNDIAGLTEGETVQYYGGSFNNVPTSVDKLCDGTKHTYYFETATENGVTTNTATCVVCGATKVQTVSADINWFAPLSGMGNFNQVLTKNLWDSDEGVMFNRFTGTAGSHFNITGGGGAGQPTSAAFPSGKYIAIKYRSTGTTIGFNAGTYAPDFEYKDNRGKSLGTQSVANTPGNEWRVAIIDTSANTAWTSDGSAQRIYIMLTTSGSYTLDVAWVAVVDSVEEMKTLLHDGETYYNYGTNWAGAGQKLDQEDNCLHVKVALTTVGNNFKVVCSACGAVTYDYNIDKSAATPRADGSGILFRDNAAIGQYTNCTIKPDNIANAAFDAKINQLEAGSPCYVRFNPNPNMADTSARRGRNMLGGKVANDVNYLVIKYRVGKNGFGQDYMKFYVGKEAESNALLVKVVEDNQWHTMVVDLKARVGDGTVFNGSFAAANQEVWFQPFGDVDRAALKSNTNSYVDFAYAAGCTTLDDVAKLVGSDTYEWSVSSTQNEIRSTATHEAVIAE